ncbi:MAG TPA: EMC3/TMCO1 family protein [Candidatus Deferrimicrobiaceae bacterium]|nr:EMC3/TMCO1 family protein [Candidatus Deferrimicrobiaceae bacterium]
MKSLNKVLFIFLVSLMAISAVASPIFAQSTNLTATATITATNGSVGEAASYTFTIQNTGTANLGSANITVPFGPLGYHTIRNIVVTQQPASQNWNITLIEDGAFILLLGSGDGLSTDQSVSFSFDGVNPQAEASYIWTVGISTSISPEALNTPDGHITATSTVAISSILPALAILGIALGIAFLNSGLNRILINFFVGWEQYHVMQKEMKEHRQEMMAAARANDKKQMEKLKRKQSQINSMQSKMMKPQMLQIGISFLYLIVWFLVLIPTFQSTSMAYLPGFGPIPVVYLYPLLSVFLGLVAQRVIGIMPIEPR